MNTSSLSISFSFSLSLFLRTKLPEFIQLYYHCPVNLLGDFGYDKINFLKVNEIETTCDHLVNQKLKGIDDTFSQLPIGKISNESYCNPPKRLCDTLPSSYVFNHQLYPDNLFDANLSKRSLYPALPKYLNTSKLNFTKYKVYFTLY